MTTTTIPRPGPCPTCAKYFARRARAVSLHLAGKALAAGAPPIAAGAAYRAAIHRRHLAGHSLEVSR